jgi:aryl-alcohol dehydrogenase-like predicted oxidoreductase
LMVRGSAADQARAVARAIEAGVNYFDTAASYGDGESERNLGRVLRGLGADVIVGTKVRVRDADRGRIGEAVTASLEASLQRLGRDSVDLFQLHNPVTAIGTPPDMEPAMVLDKVVTALERLREQGKTRFIGITGIGESQALREVIESERIDSVQVPLNLLNPSPLAPLSPGFPAHDFGQIMLRAKQAEVAVSGIRALAAGALSGEAGRHGIAMPQVDPIGTSPSYNADLVHAQKFLALVAEGHAGSLVEAALRYTISNEAMSTVLVGFSDMQHLEDAVAAIGKGPLSSKAMDRITTLQHEIADSR